MMVDKKDTPDNVILFPKIPRKRPNQKAAELDAKRQEMMRLQHNKVYVQAISEQLTEFFIPTPRIPEDEYEQICKEASDFVWAKHRPWVYDDMFAEYMCLVNDMCIDKWNELYG